MAWSWPWGSQIAVKKNCLFIYKNFLSKSPSVFSNVFVLRSNTHEQNTRSASHSPLTKPSCSTSKYGINAFAASAIKSWNFFQKRFSNNDLCQLSYSHLKLLIKNHFFNSCNQECSWKLVAPLFQTDFKIRRKLFLA